MTINQQIKLARKAKGLTQQELADLVGCTRETIKTIEKRLKSPSFDLVQKICLVVGIEEIKIN